MYQQIIKKLESKKVAILGFGIEGNSTYQFIRRHLPNKELTIIDKFDIRISHPELKKDSYLTFVIEDNYLDDLEKYDIIIKAPGVSLKDIDTTHLLSKLSSQMELLLEEYRKQVIGITGTKGKSTTTSLLYQTLKALNQDVYLLGNIGIPVLDNIENYKKDSILVVEMSSHQLEYLHHSPHIGIILNLFEDHLDHAGSVAHYHQIKMNMFQNQKQGDISIYCKDNPKLYEKVKSATYPGDLYSVTLKNEFENGHTIYLKEQKVIFQDEILYDSNDSRILVGEHNLENMMVVLMTLKLLGFDTTKIIDTMNQFHGLEHRLECVGVVDGITYYNDTIATIPEATIAGIEGLKKVNTLIFGGNDRKIHYEDFITYLNQCSIEHLICMPETGHMIYEELKKLKTDKSLYLVETLEEAVEIAKEVTKKDSICLLSPAASSYNQYKSFKEKGNEFKTLVKKSSI